MQKVTLVVGGIPTGSGKTWAYPSGAALGTFLIPTYTLKMLDESSTKKAAFSVFRFGVLCSDGKTAVSVGLAEGQRHQVKAWIPTYRVHSARSPENGAWQVYKNFLIHDGPDNATELFATIGCIEIMGPGGFNRFNDLLIDLMKPTGDSRDEKLSAIGKSGLLSVVYEPAKRPRVKKAS